jgi:hypothetical protein
MVCLRLKVDSRDIARPVSPPPPAEPVQGDDHDHRRESCRL